MTLPFSRLFNDATHGDTSSRDDAGEFKVRRRSGGKSHQCHCVYSVSKCVARLKSGLTRRFVILVYNHQRCITPFGGPSSQSSNLKAPPLGSFVK